MDLVASCKDKLTHFRIKELKDLLTQLGLSKQGKKQDLVDRILGIVANDQVSRMGSKKNVGKEEVSRLLDDIYRKMQVSGATDLASKGQVTSETSNVNIIGEFEDPYRSDAQVRCLCGRSLETDSMIRCEDPRCHVWQHMNCVLIPEKPMEGNHLPIPEVFYCELCRLSRADPFWVTVANPLNPVKLTISNIPTDGGNPMQSVERTFQLTRADKDLLAKREYDVQAWCMLLNDKVPFRMQWPQYADLQINGVPVRVINRPGSQMLGANGRDDGPIVTPYSKDGMNKISLTGCDTRVFCIGVRIVKSRTAQQILNLIPIETVGETFEDALARICRCVGGGGATEADSDSDIEVVADSITVNLRCPMSGSRMKIAGRFKPCAHMGCFDLEVFVEMNQRSRKWQCPICLKNYSLENVIIDPYFNRITSMTRHCGEDVTELDVKPDGCWRLKAKSESERREAGDLCQWHLPDGMLCVIRADENIEPKPELMKQIKLEEGSDGHSGGLKLRISQDPGGLWKVSNPGVSNNPSYNNRLHDACGSHETKVIPMSSSATGSGRDGDDPSINQDGGVTFEFSTNNNGIEFDSVPAFNVDPLFGGFVEQTPSAPFGDAKIIVLSDSDEEIDPSGICFALPHPSNGYDGHNQEGDPSGIGFSLPHHPVITDSFEDPILMNGSNSCLGLFNSNDDEFEGIPLWPLPQVSQAGPGFQLFSADGDVSDTLVDSTHSPIACPIMNVYNDSAMGPGRTLFGDASIGPFDSHLLTDNQIDNPFAAAIRREDPSLQIFLPTRPSGATSMKSNMMTDQPDMSNGIHTEDYLSLRLGGGVSGGHGEPTVSNGFNQEEHIAPTDDASLLHVMNDGASRRSDKSTRQRSDLDSPFSFPRQKRSVRPRLYFH